MDAPKPRPDRDRAADAAQSLIQLYVDRVEQLFSTLDPFPFPERDLDHDAEEFIVGWARELPRDRPVRILIHLPGPELDTPAARALCDAVKRYFGYRAEMTSLALKELFRTGWRFLLIGAIVLALCVLASQAVSGRFQEHALGRYLEESLIILGWVANWRPLEIFLYEWWPIVRTRALYKRLAKASVDLAPVQKTN